MGESRDVAAVLGAIVCACSSNSTHLRPHSALSTTFPGSRPVTVSAETTVASGPGHAYDSVPGHLPGDSGAEHGNTALRRQ